MKTIAILAAALALTACQRAPDAEQPNVVAQRQVAKADPLVARVMRDFPVDRFTYVETPSHQGVLVDRRSGCIYNVYQERLEPILAGDKQPDCGYADPAFAAKDTTRRPAPPRVAGGNSAY